MDVVVVGCGYVGLVSGVCFASLGHNVLGIEVDETRASLIKDGIAPFHEPGLEERLRDCLSEGRFRVSSQIEDAVFGDVVFLCVQTPQAEDGALNTTFLEAAARQLGSALSTQPRRRVVVVRSTVVPKTTEDLIAPALGAIEGQLAVAANPEFLREGSAVSDFMEPDRVVIGCNEEWAGDLIAELYQSLGPDVVRTSPATAELAKCTSNALLATLISFSNEIARIAEAVPGVDAEEVLDIIHRDRRLNPVVDGNRITPGVLSYLRPGCGFGGSCLPKDLSALVNFAAGNGERPALLQAAIEINEAQPARVVSMAKTAVGGLKDRNIAVLGLAFKDGTDDIRESPGIKIATLLLHEGANVIAHDPLVSHEALLSLKQKGVNVVDRWQDALEEADACVIATRAPEFLEIESLIRRTNGGAMKVIDGRRLLDPDHFDAERFIAIGRSRDS